MCSGPECGWRSQTGRWPQIYHLASFRNLEWLGQNYRYFPAATNKAKPGRKWHSLWFVQNLKVCTTDSKVTRNPVYIWNRRLLDFMNDTSIQFCTERPRIYCYCTHNMFHLEAFPWISCAEQTWTETARYMLEKVIFLLTWCQFWGELLIFRTEPGWRILISLLINNEHE